MGDLILRTEICHKRLWNFGNHILSEFLNLSTWPGISKLNIRLNLTIAKAVMTYAKKSFYSWLCILAMGTLFSCDKESLVEPEILRGTNIIELESDLMEIVNAHRSEMGKGPLLFNEVSYRYANEHTSYMISKGGTSHDNFDTRVSSVALEVDADVVAENVAKVYLTAQEAFSNWYTSADHRKTIEGDYTHTAASIKKDKEGNLYYTQLFYR